MILWRVPVATSESDTRHRSGSPGSCNHGAKKAAFHTHCQQASWGSSRLRVPRQEWWTDSETQIGRRYRAGPPGIAGTLGVSRTGALAGRDVLGRGSRSAQARVGDGQSGWSWPWHTGGPDRSGWAYQTLTATAPYGTVSAVVQVQGAMLFESLWESWRLPA